MWLSSGRNSSRAAALLTRHVSLLVPLVCLAFVAGVASASGIQGLSVETWGWLGLAGTGAGAAGGVAALIMTRRPPLAFAAIFAAGLGVWRAAAALENPTLPWADAPLGAARAVATVEGPVEVRGAWAIAEVRVDSILRPEGLGLPPGLVQLIVPLPGPRGGEIIEVAGRFEPVNPNVPSGRRLLEEGTSAISWFPEIVPTGRSASDRPAVGALQRVQLAVESAIRHMLPEPHASLLAGLLVGSAGDMPDEFRQAMRASGTTHLVVVSGYNISLVAGALLTLPLGRRATGSALALLGIWTFVVLSGSAAPSLRAAFMGSIALIATRTGRQADGLGALGLTVAGMLAIDPRLSLDLGFQLSVVATLGLITLQPRLSASMAFAPTFLREPLAGTLAAQLATLPLLAATFHQVSVVAPLANLLAAPAVPIATIAGGIAVGVSLAVPALSGALGALLSLPTGYLISIIEAAAVVPGATTPIGAIPPLLAVLYVGMLILWAAAPTPEGQAALSAVRSPRVVRTLLAGAASGAGAAIAATAAFAAVQHPGLTFSVLDVGGGDAVLVRTPGERTVLIDGGPSPSALLAQLGRRMGLLEKSLTVAILTRADGEHLGGMVAALERYAPGLAIAPPETPPSALYHRWRAATGERLVSPDAALSIEVEPGVTLDILPTPPIPGGSRPTEAPLRSLVVRLIHGDLAFLVAPAMAPDVGRPLLDQGWSLAGDVWVLPRYGDPASLGDPLLEAVAPAMAVVPGRPRGRGPAPSGPPDAFSLLPTYRTDLHGSVDVLSDGRQLRVRTDRPAP